MLFLAILILDYIIAANIWFLGFCCCCVFSPSLPSGVAARCSDHPEGFEPGGLPAALPVSAGLLWALQAVGGGSHGLSSGCL